MKRSECNKCLDNMGMEARHMPIDYDPDWLDCPGHESVFPVREWSKASEFKQSVLREKDICNCDQALLYKKTLENILRLYDGQPKCNKIEQEVIYLVSSVL